MSPLVEQIKKEFLQLPPVEQAELVDWIGGQMPVASESVTEKNRIYKTWITTDPITGFPVLTAEEGAPKLTNAIVREMLADFP